MKGIIKSSKFFGFLLTIFIYSCESQNSAEVTPKEENQVLTTSKVVLKASQGAQTLKWCVFGSYCDRSGRNYPAKFSVNIWNIRNGEKQEQLPSNYSNDVQLNEDGDYAGSTLCLDLKNSPGIDEFYVEVKILNSDAYGQITEKIIREGIIDENEIRNLYAGEEELDYFHFREGCDSPDTPDLFQN